MIHTTMTTQKVFTGNNPIPLWKDKVQTKQQQQNFSNLL